MAINFAAVLMAAAVVASAVTGSAAQNPPSCASNLVGCASYLNSTTTPPQTCCGPLKQTATNDLPCLCGLFNNTVFLKAFGVDLQKALQMARRCGVTTDQSACATAAATPSPSPGSKGPSSSSSSSTSNTTGSSTPTSQSPNSAFVITPSEFGVPALMSLVLSLLPLVA
ncbi:non-specific lipid transfer protein GPI-anchored 9-like [Zingiber officinale]|uniref:non-specific lipid transfer protein GPI-anchored 9-like n=1 Tax=Zingiber officinale TaxID=94328 RepID=UPI001C4C656F|nr:non-specific lipid transfer protein GPI-anchored 9-like [Zingiber officinale]